jgi:pyrroloquinoline quinone (PQQ) biosynthesis protein C
MTAIDAKPGEDFIEELEAIRDSWGGEDRSARGARSREQAADARRKSLRGSSNNHAFTGEQYLNCTDKSLRRIHLQKIMDEGGQTNFGGPIPSHILLAKWEAEGYGVPTEEIQRLEHEDQTPENLITGGWRIYTTRHEPFPITTGLSYEGEGGRYIESMRNPEKIKTRLDALRQQFEEWDVDDVDKAMMNASVHAEADEDHGRLTQEAIRRYADTPELQEKMRQVFILRHQSRGGF